MAANKAIKPKLSAPKKKKGANKGWSNLKPARKGEPSRNPKGRPKLEESAGDLIRQIGAKLRDADPGGRTNAEWFADKLFDLAAKGNPSAINQLCDRLWGKVKQPIDVPPDSEIGKIARLILVSKK